MLPTISPSMLLATTMPSMCARSVLDISPGNYHRRSCLHSEHYFCRACIAWIREMMGPAISSMASPFVQRGWTDEITTAW